MNSTVLRPSALTIALVAAMSMMAAAHAQQAAELEKVVVTGEGDKLGTGLIVDEDASKSKSTVTKAQLEKSRGSTNPFQALTLLPGVNSSSYDASGLFGGNLRVRGFNSDQMGFTINGAPVNDSGNFAVFPQEYTDGENLCEMFITQGQTDNEAPHVGASGGNVGLSSCRPEPKPRVRVALSGGQLDYMRSFVRLDTGKIGDFASFISYSKSQVDKWKGTGRADRDHVDAAVEYKSGPVDLAYTLLYNRAVNNNFRSITLQQFDTQGYYTDFAPTPPKHLAPVAGTAQNEGTIASGTAYSGYALNPFENYLMSLKSQFKVAPGVRIDVEPYYWYGYGTGGVQQTSVAESAAAGTRLHGGIRDINGDGDTLDTVLIYRGSVTETHRPGVNARVNWNLDYQKIMAGFWLERAQHRQTQPGSRVDNAGNIDDLWLDDASKLLRYNDGALYQGRDWLTVSTGRSVFAQDVIDVPNTKFTVTPAISWRQIKRKFDNFASSGAGGGADYHVDRSYSETLPSLGISYAPAPGVQIYGGVTRNFRVPSNFELSGSVQGTVNYANGQAVNPLVEVRNTVKQEKSTNFDVGTRYRNELFKASASAFLVKFKDRIAAGYDPIQNGRYDINVGDSTVKGLELEAGTVPVKGFSAYGSVSYTRSTIDQNLLFTPSSTSTAFYVVNSAGKQFPDTPKLMYAAALQYSVGPFLANLNAKYTGQRQLTLNNDQSIGSYTLVDLNFGYKLPSQALFKDPIVRLNISNLFDKKYFLANSGSGSNITPNAFGTGGSQPTIYSGSPRFVSVTLQFDFY